jgi:hypothetical protein
MMEDNNQLDGEEDVFVYMGGEQEVPHDVIRAKIDESIDTILAEAFAECEQLTEVEGHNQLKKIEHSAFNECTSLRRLMKMTGVKEIEGYAFCGCSTLSDLELDNLEIVGYRAFGHCRSLRSINMPFVRRVDTGAFWWCTALTEAVFGEGMEGIGGDAFLGCTTLSHIAIPLKDNLIIGDGTFNWCTNLSSVDVIGGGIHKTISSLHMESWKSDMYVEIDVINQTLPDIPPLHHVKTQAIQQWIRSVLARMEHYKVEHRMLVKEAMALLELALWKAKLADNVPNIDAETVCREEHRVTCGASIVIKNVLPFLALK